jgi:hypothetical protein
MNPLNEDRMRELAVQGAQLAADSAIRQISVGDLYEVVRVAPELRYWGYEHRAPITVQVRDIARRVHATVELSETAADRFRAIGLLVEALIALPDDHNLVAHAIAAIADGSKTPEEAIASLGDGWAAVLAQYHGDEAQQPAETATWTAADGVVYDLAKTYTDSYSDSWRFIGQWWNVPDPDSPVPLMRPAGQNLGVRVTLPWIIANLGPVTAAQEPAGAVA